MQAWTEYSRRVATDRQGKRTSLQPGQQTTVDRYLYFADQYKAAKNLDEALKSVLDAEALLHKSLPADTSSPKPSRSCTRRPTFWAPRSVLPKLWPRWMSTTCTRSTRNAHPPKNCAISYSSASILRSRI